MNDDVRPLPSQGASGPNGWVKWKNDNIHATERQNDKNCIGTRV